MKSVSLERFEAFDEAPPPARFGIPPNPPLSAPLPPSASFPPNPLTPAQHGRESAPPKPPTPAQQQYHGESALPNPPTPSHHYGHESAPPLPPTPSQPPPSPPLANLPPSAPSLPPPAPDATKEGAQEARPPAPERTAEADDDEVDGGGSSRNGDGRQLFGLGVTFKKSDGKGGMVIKRVKPEGRAAIAGVIKVLNPPV